MNEPNSRYLCAHPQSGFHQAISYPHVETFQAPFSPDMVLCEGTWKDIGCGVCLPSIIPMIEKQDERVEHCNSDYCSRNWAALERFE